ncbi:unnamed protein product, partial [Notodromas monacha]
MTRTPVLRASHDFRAIHFLAFGELPVLATATLPSRLQLIAELQHIEFCEPRKTADDAEESDFCMADRHIEPDRCFECERLRRYAGPEQRVVLNGSSTRHHIVSSDEAGANSRQQGTSSLRRNASATGSKNKPVQRVVFHLQQSSPQSPTTKPEFPDEFSLSFVSVWESRKTLVPTDGQQPPRASHDFRAIHFLAFGELPVLATATLPSRLQLIAELQHIEFCEPRKTADDAEESDFCMADRHIEPDRCFECEQLRRYAGPEQRVVLNGSSTRHHIVSSDEAGANSRQQGT